MKSLIEYWSKLKESRSLLCFRFNNKNTLARSLFTTFFGIWRELAEKHTSLLRRYDKETKVNKRLSMDKEELTWKLNRAATESPNLYRRSNSSQPTKSAPGTPMLARRPVSLVLASHADESDPEMPGDFLELSSERCWYFSFPASILSNVIAYSKRRHRDKEMSSIILCLQVTTK